MDDKELMQMAYKEAELAFQKGECPVGAVLVINGEVIAKAGNRENETHDSTAHAEILVLREAGRNLKRHKFPDAVVYTTLWPCPQCENAMLQAQVPTVISGARSFHWIYETRFDKKNIRKLGPIMEPPCREIFIRWAKKNNRMEILKEEGLL